MVRQAQQLAISIENVNESDPLTQSPKSVDENVNIDEVAAGNDEDVQGYNVEVETVEVDDVEGEGAAAGAGNAEGGDGGGEGGLKPSTIKEKSNAGLTVSSANNVTAKHNQKKKKGKPLIKKKIGKFL